MLFDRLHNPMNSNAATLGTSFAAVLQAINLFTLVLPQNMPIKHLESKSLPKCVEWIDLTANVLFLPKSKFRLSRGAEASAKAATVCAHRLSPWNRCITLSSHSAGQPTNARASSCSYWRSSVGSCSANRTGPSCSRKTSHQTCLRISWTHT